MIPGPILIAFLALAIGVCRFMEPALFSEFPIMWKAWRNR